MSSRPISPDKCNVHLRTTESVKLRTLFETLHPLLVDGVLHFDKHGVTMLQLNGVVMAYLFVSSVEDYVCNEPTDAGVNFGRLYSCLRSVCQEDAVCIQ